MKKLTAEVARRDISHLTAFQKQPNIGLSLREETYLQALEIALPILEQQEQGLSMPAGYRMVPEKLTNEMLRRIIPNMAHSLPISHDEYDYYGRNERFVKWVWARLLELSEAAKQEQPTNQNGEQ